jgi:hypothetical protein
VCTCLLCIRPAAKHSVANPARRDHVVNVFVDRTEPNAFDHAMILSTGNQILCYYKILPPASQPGHGNAYLSVRMTCSCRHGINRPKSLERDRVTDEMLFARLANAFLC